MSRLPTQEQDLLAAIEGAVQERTAARDRLREAQGDAAPGEALVSPEDFLPLWNAWKRAQRRLEALRRTAREAGLILPTARRRRAPVCPVCGYDGHDPEATR